MTKKQIKIHNWLISKPGYIKKSYSSLPKSFFLDNKQATEKDFKVARLKASKNFPLSIFVEKGKKKPKNVTTEVVKDAMKVVSKDVRSPKVVRDGIVKLEMIKPIKESYLRKLTTPGLYFVFGCVHAPFHHVRAFKAVNRLLKDNREDIVGIVLAGDFIDANSLSSHDKGKKPLKGVTLDWEYTESQYLLDSMFEHLSSSIHKVYIYGNHEDRYLRYMSDSDNSKLGEALPSPETGLNLKERGFRVFTNWKEDYITLGHYLDVSHGEFTNVHTAKKHIDTYRRSTLYYHTHRIQQYIEGQVGGFNGGSMADFSQPVFNYATRAMKSSWLNGFTAVHIDSDGGYHIQQIMCYNNIFVFGNKIYNY